MSSSNGASCTYPPGARRLQHQAFKCMQPPPPYSSATAAAPSHIADVALPSASGAFPVLEAPPAYASVVGVVGAAGSRRTPALAPQNVCAGADAECRRCAWSERAMACCLREKSERILLALASVALAAALVCVIILLNRLSVQ